MKILVTGGAGYIGSVLVPMLLKHGHSVTVLDNFMYRQVSLLECCSSRNFRVIRADIRDLDILKEELPKADVILPLACLTGAPACAKDPKGAYDINYESIKFISDMKSPSQLLVFPSTNSGYGVGQSNIYCDEDTPLQPVSTYGRLKVEIEKYLLDKGDSVTFRFATLFGISPRMRLDLLVNDFTFRAFTDRFVVLFEHNFKRNYLHVRDAARAFLHAIDKYEDMVGNPYNVGLSDANLSKKELCETIQSQLPEFQILFSEFGSDPDKRNYIVSNDRIESTGYRTSISLNDGIQELILGFNILERQAYSNL